MADVVWSPQALDDVVRITRYISPENPAAAARIARELLLAGDSLAIFPRRGRRIGATGARELLGLRPYVIVYQVAGDEGADEIVDVLRVWHAAQDR